MYITSNVSLTLTVTVQGYLVDQEISLAIMGHLLHLERQQNMGKRPSAHASQHKSPILQARPRWEACRERPER